MDTNIEGYESAPDECPECGAEPLTFYLTESDRATRVKCGNFQCDEDVVFESDFEGRESHPDELYCKSYDPCGRLFLIEPEVYVCCNCHRFHVLAETSNGVPYPAIACAICLENTRVEFHHWDYEDDIGIYICRDCHEYIHDGMTAQQQAMGKKQNCEYYARENLKELHEKYHGPMGEKQLNDRYNIPW